MATKSHNLEVKKMILFANSNPTPRDLRMKTQAAGALVLHTISEVWKYAAALERDEGKNVPQSNVSDTATNLDNAATEYFDVAKAFQKVTVFGLTSAEREIARVPLDLGGDAEALSTMIAASEVKMETLYFDVGQRLQDLAAGLRSLPFDRDVADLAPQVFGMMRKIELLSSLGRVIAVLNRRSPDKSDSDD